MYEKQGAAQGREYICSFWTILNIWILDLDVQSKFIKRKGKPFLIAYNFQIQAQLHYKIPV